MDSYSKRLCRLAKRVKPSSLPSLFKKAWLAKRVKPLLCLPKRGEAEQRVKMNVIHRLGVVAVFLFIFVSFSSDLFLKSIASKGDFYLTVLTKMISPQVANNDSLLASQKFSPESPQFILVESSILLASTPPTTFSPQVLGVLMTGDEPEDVKKVVTEYIVESGDTLSSLSVKFDISLDTILWANNLTERSTIKPEQNLVILPVSGVIHRVKNEDTISDIAEIYQAKAEEIIAFNHLSEDGRIFIDQRLIIPGGKMPPTRSTVARVGVSSQLSTNNFYGQSHAFPFGQCTWWVAQRRAIPAWGHAKNWLNNAAADGYQICRGSNCVPEKGAVIIVRGNPIFGHVAYVEKVQGNQVTFSEMNNIGLGIMNYRTLAVGNSSIIGYIY